MIKQALVNIIIKRYNTIDLITGLDNIDIYKMYFNTGSDCGYRGPNSSAYC